MNATAPAILQTIVDFLNGIGIETREGELPAAAFLPGAFGLAQAGMTFIGAGPRSDGMRVYPAMSRWLRA